MKNVVVHIRVSILDRKNGLASQKRAIQRWLGTAIAKSLAAEGASVIVNYASRKAGADSVCKAVMFESAQPDIQRRERH